LEETYHEFGSGYVQFEGLWNVQKKSVACWKESHGEEGTRLTNASKYYYYLQIKEHGYKESKVSQDFFSYIYYYPKFLKQIR
jgi:hypothetical protein